MIFVVRAKSYKMLKIYMNLVCFKFILNGKQAETIVICVYIQSGSHPNAWFALKLCDLAYPSMATSEKIRNVMFMVAWQNSAIFCRKLTQLD